MTSRSIFPVRGGLFSPQVPTGSMPWTACPSRVERGETLSLVGEFRLRASRRWAERSCDCSTSPPARWWLDGQRIDNLSPGGLCAACAAASRWCSRIRSPVSIRGLRVRDILAEPIRNFGLAKSSAELEARVVALMDTVRLPARTRLNRRPHEFSGRSAPAHRHRPALAAEARTDRLRRGRSRLSTSSVKAQIVNLLQDLQAEFGLALLFISHDLAIVEHMTHPCRGDVSRQDRRDGAEAAKSSPRRSIPTPRRCSRPCRCRSPAPSATR